MAELERKLETLAKNRRSRRAQGDDRFVTREGRIDEQLAELDQFCWLEENRIEEIRPG